MIALLLALGSALPVSAQEISASTAAVAVSTAAPSPEELRKIKDKAPPVALALDLAFGPAVWAEIKISTMGPVHELTRLVRQGHYKLEIIQLVLLSAKGKKTLKQTLEKRGKKKMALAAIAKDYKLDYDELYEAALAVQDIVDRQYLPRFPEKRLRRDEEEQ